MRLSKKSSSYLLIFLLLFMTFFLSLTNGAVTLSLATVFQALFHFDPSNQEHLIFHDIRLPRTIAAFIVGSSLATAGMIMQTITKNPLADAGLLGINAGAGFALALSFILFPKANYLTVTSFSFLGATFAVGLIFLITKLGKHRLDPLKLILAGTAINAVFVALSQALGLYFNLNQDLAFWFIGGAANVTWQQLFLALPLFGVVLVISFLLSRSLALLNLGDEHVQSLGKHPDHIRFIYLLIVLFLAGLSVSLVGNISFVGLMVPHITKKIMGYHLPSTLPFTALLGGLFVILADLLARLVNAPFETPFGILLAIIGVPFLLYLVRRTLL